MKNFDKNMLSVDVDFVKNLALDETPPGFGSNQSTNELDTYYPQSDLNLID